MSAQPSFGLAARLTASRDVEGRPVIEQLVVAGHARMTTASSIRCDYAAYHDGIRAAGPIWLAGAKRLMIVPTRQDGMIPASDLGAALADLLGVVDVFFIHGRSVSLGGVPFPHLAFDEFVEALLFWPVIVGVDPEAVGTVDVVDLCMFHPPEAYRDLLAALLARDWARFVIELEHGFIDPVWALYQQSRWPGHSALFLANVRRSASDSAPVAANLSPEGARP